MGRQIGRMKTINTTNIILFSFEAGAGILFRGTSHEADLFHRRPGSMHGEGGPSAGAEPIIRDGFVTLPGVVNNYPPDNTALTAE